MSKREELVVNVLLTQTGKRIVMEGTATAPTVGTWAVGDVVLNSVPTAGGVFANVCTTAGTPGTWKTVAVGS